MIRSAGLFPYAALAVAAASWGAEPPRLLFPALSPVVETRYVLGAALSGPDGRDPVVIARDYLEPAEGAFELRLLTRSASRGGRLRHVIFERVRDGIALWGGEAHVHLDDAGRIVRVSAARAPGAVGSPDVGFEAWEAVAAAQPGRWTEVGREDGPERRTRFASAAGQAAEAWLVWAAARTVREGRPARAALAWRVVLGDRETLVDAGSGVVLGSVEFSHDAAPTGRVFRAPDVAHPGEGAQTVETFGLCEADVYPAPFRSGPLDGLCWSSNGQTAGPNVAACADANGDDACDGLVSATGGVFDFPYTGSYRAGQGAQTDRSAAVVNAFYWTNAVHDWLYRLGFDEASGNFQLDNYGRGGTGGDRVVMEVHDGALGGATRFTAGPDGVPGRLELGLHATSLGDAAFDGDLLVHEYVHGLTARLVGGPAHAAALGLQQSGALAEGWSDAYAASFTGDSVIGEFTSGNAATGLRRVDLGANTLTFGDFGRRHPAAVPGRGLQPVPEIHTDGEIWASTLWDLRQALGAAAFEEIATAALKLTPARPTMLDARDAFVQAALGDACDAWAVFAARGFGASAAVNPVEDGLLADTAVSVYEAFDRPPACGGAPADLSYTVFSDGVDQEEEGWEATGPWTRFGALGGDEPRVWHFGDPTPDAETYASGQPAAGTLTSPEIDLRGASEAELVLLHRLRTEGFASRVDLGGGAQGPYRSRDAARLLISSDGGLTWDVLTHLMHQTPGSGYSLARVNLRDYVDRRIRLRFEFDSLDAVDNDYFGWRIGQVAVRATNDVVGPRLAVQGPPTLTFQGEAGGPPVELGTIAIANAGSGELVWEIEPDVPWLRFTPHQGVEDGEVRAQADPGSLTPGTYLGGFRVSSRNERGALQTVEFQVTSPAVPAVDASPSRWPLDEAGAGPGLALADVAGGRTLTTGGLGTVDVAGISGRARLFNGFTDSAEAAHQEAFTPERFTFRAWVRLDSLPATLAVIASHFGGSPVRGWYLGVWQTGQVAFSVATEAGAQFTLSNAVLAPGEWHRLTLAVDRHQGRAVLAVDGEWDTWRDFGVPLLAASGPTPFTVARASWANAFPFQGALDELELLDRTTAPPDWQADFESFTPPAPAPPAAPAWEFESSGGSSSDAYAGFGEGLHVPGVVGEALRLDGVDDVWQVASDEGLQPSDFTVRGWFRLTRTPAAWGALVANYDGDFSGWYLGVLPGGKAFFALGAKPSSLPSVETYSGLTPNRWHHLTATYEARIQRLSLYLDGELHGRRYVSGMTPRTSGLMTVGRASWIDAHYAAFDVDELAVERASWTAAEAAADFASYPAPAQPGPLAAWSFDDLASGAGTALVDSASGHDAVTVADRNRPLTGVSGVARSFGGWPDAAVVAPDPAFESYSFSFSTWARIDEPPDGWGVLFGNHDGDYRGWLVGVYHDGRVVFSVTGRPASSPWLLSSAALEPGRWHHVAVTFDGASRRGRIYVDGVLSASAVFPAWTPAPGVRPTFGRASWVPSVYLKMKLDEAKLYGFERPPAEIAAEFDALAFVANPSPVAAWDFEEAASTASDGTGHGRGITFEGLTEAAPGLVGQGRRLTGRPAYGRLAPDAALASSAFTWTSWVRIEESPPSWGVLYSTYGDGSRGWYAAMLPDGRIVLSVAGPGSAPWLVSRGAIAPGEWRHVAVTFDPVSRRGAIYLDGLLDETAVFPASTPPSLNVAPTVGKASWTDSYYLPVTLDRMRVFGAELSESAVRSAQ